MACMCGDLACPSCGPAQGANLEEEAFYEMLYEKFPGLDDVFDKHPFMESFVGVCVEEGRKAERQDISEGMCMRERYYELEQERNER